MGPRLGHPSQIAARLKVYLSANVLRPALREALGLTQEEAARRAGLAGRGRWNDIENGRLARLCLRTIEAALGRKRP